MSVRPHVKLTPKMVDGQLVLLDDYGRIVQNVAAIRLVQSWNEQAPTGSKLENGVAMVTVDLLYHTSSMK